MANGNVNDTFLVTVEGAAEPRLYPATPQPTRGFRRPELVMGNLGIVGGACGPRSGAAPLSGGPPL